MSELLDLDQLQAEPYAALPEDVRALVAEVRRLRVALRCGAEGHPEVRPESLVPCMLNKGHDGQHWSTSGCSGGAVKWDTALMRAEAERDEARAALQEARTHCKAWRDLAVRAFTLAMYGEGAPGSTDSWRRFEADLRDLSDAGRAGMLRRHTLRRRL